MWPLNEEHVQWIICFLQLFAKLLVNLKSDVTQQRSAHRARTLKSMFEKKLLIEAKEITFVNWILKKNSVIISILLTLCR